MQSKFLGTTLALGTVLVSLLPAMADEMPSTSVTSDGAGTAVKNTTVSDTGASSTSTSTTSVAPAPAVVKSTKTTSTSTKTYAAPPTSQSTTTTTVSH